MLLCLAPTWTRLWPHCHCIRTPSRISLIQTCNLLTWLSGLTFGLPHHYGIAGRLLRTDLLCFILYSMKLLPTLFSICHLLRPLKELYRRVTHKLYGKAKSATNTSYSVPRPIFIFLFLWEFKKKLSTLDFPLLTAALHLPSNFRIYPHRKLGTGETECELVHYCSQGPTVHSFGVHKPRLPHTCKNIPPSMVSTDYSFFPIQETVQSACVILAPMLPVIRVAHYKLDGVFLHYIAVWVVNMPLVGSVIYEMLVYILC